jgi:hypothetical protein
MIYAAADQATWILVIGPSDKGTSLPVRTTALAERLMQVCRVLQKWRLEIDFRLGILVYGMLWAGE